MKKLNTKGFSLLGVLLIIVVIGLVAGIGYYVYQAKKSNDASLGKTTNSTTAQQAQEVSNPSKETPAKASETKTETISDDIVVCNVNTKAQSGGGLKIAFYGYVKGDDYSKVWVEYGSSSDNLDQKTAQFNNGPDSCEEFLAHMPAADLKAGKYYYRIAATNKNGVVVYSKTDSFTNE